MSLYQICAFHNPAKLHRFHDDIITGVFHYISFLKIYETAVFTALPMRPSKVRDAVFTISPIFTPNFRIAIFPAVIDKSSYMCYNYENIKPNRGITMHNELLRRVWGLGSAVIIGAGCVLPAAADDNELPVITLDAAAPAVVINEVCTGNGGTNGNLTDAVDKNGDPCDWVELYNPADTEADLTGLTLVKDGKDSFALDGVKIAPKGFTVVYCCKTYNGDESKPHAGFNLSGSGVKLALMDGENEVDTLEVPALADDTVWARKPDGTGEAVTLLPTPAASNNEAASAVPCNAPVFGTESGMYSSAFDLTLTTDEGNTIYYTTDDTDPATSSTRKEYTVPIKVRDRSPENMVMASWLKVSEITPWSDGASLPKNSAVDKCTVIRAVTYSAAGEYSETLTNSYFVGVSNSDHNGLPILSVTTDPASLFDYDTGIYRKGRVYDEVGKPAGGGDTAEANYNQRGKEWERPCHIDFFESDGTLAISQDCGMRTQGGYSRADYQKALRFYARDEYGKKNFKYTFFEDAYREDGSGEQLAKFKKLVMRAGGNDTNSAKFKDSYLQALLSGRAFDTQEGRPCVMFIDGEYWGLYTLQEDYDDHYFEENYGVNADEVVVYKKGEIDEGNEEDIALFDELRAFAENNDLSKAGNYERIGEMLDIKSFADYMAAEIYILNEDWPGNNYSMWRVRNTDSSNPYADGRWRMLLYDTEMGVDHYGNWNTHYNSDNLKNILKNNKDDLPVIFNALLKNAEFKTMFVNAILDISNIDMAPDRAAEVEKKYMEAYYPELDKSYARFPTWANRRNAADPCIERMDTFLANRPAYIPTMLKSDLSLKNDVTVNISAVRAEGGTVKLNGTPIDLSSAFTGTYFGDCKITLTAEAKDGYRFAGWTGTVSSTDAEISISPAEAGSVRALFLRGDEKLCKVTFTDGEKSVDTYVMPGENAVFPESVFTKAGYTASVTGLDKITSDKTINVTYTGNSYKLKLFPNGGKGSTVTFDAVYGKEIALPANTFTREGYTFKGWSRKTTGNSEFADGAKVSDLTTGSSVTLYAIWAKNAAETKDISACAVSTESTGFICTGAEIRPAVTVTDGNKTLTEGKDYTLAYENNTECGNAKVIVKGTGAYGGTAEAGFNIVPDKPKLTKLARSKSAVKLTWDAVQGAQSYKVYRLNGSSYKLIKNTASTSFTDSKLAVGTEYRYRIYAVGGGIKSARTSYATCTKSAVPTLKGSSSAKGRLKLSWSKSSTGTGYQVAFSTKQSSGYKLLKTLPLSTASYTRTKLKTGKTYYFKVRVYQTVGTKKFYSGFSNVVKVTIK